MENGDRRWKRKSTGFRNSRPAFDSSADRWKEFRERHNDWGRDLVFYLGRRLSSVKLKDLGRAAGGLDYAAVRIAVKRFERRLKAEKPLAQLLKRTTATPSKILNIETQPRLNPHFFRAWAVGFS